MKSPMLNPNRLLRRLRSLLTVRRLDEELDEELRFHLEMETAKNLRAGMDERIARQSAQRDFGGVSRHRAEARDARGVRAVEDFVQDLRVALRAMAKQRTYAVVAILTLAIGIGATTALWAAVYRVLLEPYPFSHADRIVSVRQYDVRTPSSYGEFAPANYLDLKARSRSFDLLAAAEPYSFDWVGPEAPEQFETTLVTEDFFPIQGLAPLIGRVFVPDEFKAGREHVVLMSEQLWRTRFGSDTSLVGRTLVLDSVPRTVIGVMPHDALQPYGAEVWAPKIVRPDELRSRSSGYWTVIGRLGTNVTLEQARDEMRRVAAQLATEHPTTNRSTGISLATLREAIAGGVRRVLLVLFGAVAFVLLIACVNVANLQLAECIRRQRELAIRTAIGAGRGRLVRQLLTESFLLALLGAVAGLFIAYWGIAAIRAFAPEDLWQLARLRLDRMVLLFALTLAVVCAGAAALMPVIAAGRVRLSESLAAGGRAGSAGIARRRVNRALVVSEVALALVLLVGAGLLLRSLSTLLRVDRGFRTEGVLVTTVHAWGYYPTPARRAEFVRQAVERLSAIPGVQKVGMTSSLPLSYPIGFQRPRVSVEGQSVPPGDELPSVLGAAATSGYFEALDIRIERGRSFSPTDIEGSPPVVLVNRAFVRRFFGDVNPLGKRVSFGFMGAPVAREIVGVVGNVRHDGLHAEPAPSVFIPHTQGATGAIHLVSWTSGDPGALERRVRSEISALNGAMPLSEVTTMNALLGRSLRERRFQIALLTTFSVVALLLSAIGIYGVMSRTTSERTHEIGVRMAVGARASDVRWMVLRNGGALALVGIAAGVAIALLLTRYMTGMLFGVTPLDPMTYVASAGILLMAAVMATWLPAWRASSVDPVIALRSD
ncbi:MAG: ABC transporter permease [Gemmatimonadaceae bacterium]